MILVMQCMKNLRKAIRRSMKNFIICTFCDGKGKVEVTPRVILGLKIKSFRKKAGLNHADVGKRLGLTRTSIINIEQGKQNTTIDTLYKLSEIFNVSVNDFFTQQSEGENK